MSEPLPQYNDVKADLKGHMRDLFTRWQHRRDLQRALHKANDHTRRTAPLIYVSLTKTDPQALEDFLNAACRLPKPVKAVDVFRVGGVKIDSSGNPIVRVTAPAEPSRGAPSAGTQPRPRKTQPLGPVKPSAKPERTPIGETALGRPSAFDVAQAYEPTGPSQVGANPAFEAGGQADADLGLDARTELMGPGSIDFAAAPQRLGRESTDGGIKRDRGRTAPSEPLPPSARSAAVEAASAYETEAPPAESAPPGQVEQPQPPQEERKAKADSDSLARIPFGRKTLHEPDEKLSVSQVYPEGARKGRRESNRGRSALFLLLLFLGMLGGAYALVGGDDFRSWWGSALSVVGLGPQGPSEEVIAAAQALDLVALQEAFGERFELRGPEEALGSALLYRFHDAEAPRREALEQLALLHPDEGFEVERALMQLEGGDDRRAPLFVAGWLQAERAFTDGVQSVGLRRLSELLDDPMAPGWIKAYAWSLRTTFSAPRLKIKDLDVGEPYDTGLRWMVRPRGAAPDAVPRAFAEHLTMVAAERSATDRKRLVNSLAPDALLAEQARRMGLRRFVQQSQVELETRGFADMLEDAMRSNTLLELGPTVLETRDRFLMMYPEAPETEVLRIWGGLKDGSIAPESAGRDLERVEVDLRRDGHPVFLSALHHCRTLAALALGDAEAAQSAAAAAKSAFSENIATAALVAEIVPEADGE